MKLYNTLTRKIEEFIPAKAPTVTMYCCGPTVYDYPHIGNWFTFLRYDILVRTLKGAGYKPDWVMNITDVGHLVSDADEGEDKLEKGAKREGKSAWQIAEFYSNYFMQGIKRLNMATPNELPRATEHIHEQIDMIKDLEKKGYTYIIDDGVYYDTARFKDYGQLARLDVAHLKPGARVDINHAKRQPADFALWKFSPRSPAGKRQRDMEWPSPWGVGFPGWHIECSAMICKYFGPTIDIHAGGIDHIPIHHTNEIAQSQAATGQRLARYWVHMNHITVNAQKISKSAGNGITLEDIEQRHIPLEALRLLVLESHYQSQAEFSWENLTAAHNRLLDLQAMADLKWQSTDRGKFNATATAKVKQAVEQAMENNLNSPAALAHISTAAKALEANGLQLQARDEFEKFLIWLDELFGLTLAQRHDISTDQKELIAERETTKNGRDWAAADMLRQKLSQQGIGLRDTATGPVWFRL